MTLPRLYSMTPIANPSKREYLVVEGHRQEVNMESAPKTVSPPSIVRISVLGLAGVTVNNNHLSELRRGDGTFHTNACPASANIMRCVVAASRNQQIMGISDLSKPLTPSSKHHPDHLATGEDSRHLAVWANGQERSLGSLMTLDLSESKEFDLTIGLTDGSVPLVALPIGVASVRLRENAAPISIKDTMVIDIPIRKALKKEMISIQSNSLQKKEETKMKKRWFGKKRKSGIPSLAQRKAFSSVYGTDSSGDAVLRVELQVIHRRPEPAQEQIEISLKPDNIKHNIVDLDDSVVDDDPEPLQPENKVLIAAASAQFIEDEPEQQEMGIIISEEEKRDISIEEIEMLKRLEHKKLSLKTIKEQLKVNDEALKNHEDKLHNRSATEAAAKNLSRMFRGALDLAASQYRYYTESADTLKPSASFVDENGKKAASSSTDRPPTFVLIDTANFKSTIAKDEDTDPMTSDESLEEASLSRWKRWSVPETKEDEPSQILLKRRSVPETKEDEPSQILLKRRLIQEKHEGHNPLVHFLQCSGGLDFPEDEYQDELDAAFLSRQLYQSQPILRNGKMEDFTEDPQRQQVPEEIQIQHDLESTTGELTLNSTDFREYSFPTIQKYSFPTIQKDTSILRKPRYSNPGKWNYPVAPRGKYTPTPNSRKPAIKDQNQIAPDDEVSCKSKNNDEETLGSVIEEMNIQYFDA